jgi:hypothetical protein
MTSAQKRAHAEEGTPRHSDTSPPRMTCSRTSASQVNTQVDWRDVKRHIRALGLCITASLVAATVGFSAPAHAAPSIDSWCRQVYPDGLNWSVTTNKSSRTYVRLVRGSVYYDWQQGEKIGNYRYRNNYYWPIDGTYEWQVKTEDSTGYAIRSMGDIYIPGNDPPCG